MSRNCFSHRSIPFIEILSISQITLTTAIIWSILKLSTRNLGTFTKKFGYSSFLDSFPFVEIFFFDSKSLRAPCEACMRKGKNWIFVDNFCDWHLWTCINTTTFIYWWWWKFDVTRHWADRCGWKCGHILWIKHVKYKNWTTMCRNISIV